MRPLPVSGEYRVVGATWALGVTGHPAGDVVVLEHYRGDKACMVWSTTLGMTPDEIAQAIDMHEQRCRYNQQGEHA